MKRFFCTVCKKVRRVRKLPVNVDTPQATLPTQRIGQCNFHTSGHVRQSRKVAVQGSYVASTDVVMDYLLRKNRKAGR